MANDPVRALIYPFEKGLLGPFGKDRAAIIRAEASPALRAFDDVELVCEQTFKPTYDQLQDQGFAVTRRLDGRFQLVLCLLTKDKTEALANVARGWSLLQPGGLLVCSGGNDIGAKAVEQRLRSTLGDLQGLSKYHGRTFWAWRRDREMPSIFEDWSDAAMLQPVAGTQYQARAGSFGWRQIDEGSKLLVANLPVDLNGAGADLGAGWGYLTTEVLQACPEVAGVDLYEAEWLALEAARANIRPLRPQCDIRYRWHDVLSGLPDAAYHWAVMNPPFHGGKLADPDLGRAFIAAAGAALRPGGRLIMVANRHLPYEAALDRHFQRIVVRAESARFKVIEASR